MQLSMPNVKCYYSFLNFKEGIIIYRIWIFCIYVC